MRYKLTPLVKNNKYVILKYKNTILILINVLNDIKYSS
jgi:hypothetical protein